MVKGKSVQLASSVIIFLIVWGFLSGCGGSSDSNDSTTTKEYTPVSADFENAADQATVAALVSNTSTITYSAVQEDLLSIISGLSITGSAQNRFSRANETNEIYDNDGCPVITTTGTLLDRILIITFQEGCEMDEMPVSGTISGQWDYAATSGELSIDLDLDDFKVDDRTMDGGILLGADMSDKAAIAIDADLSITNAEGETDTFSVENLAIVCDFNSTYLDPEDDQYTLNGTGQATDAEENTYSLTFTNVVSNFLCYFPVSGKLTIVSTTPQYTAIIDFGSGTCDTLATITIGKVTKNVDFSEPLNF